jgi:hypothetical protein
LWNAAVNFCKEYARRINPFPKIFIHFNKMQGVYTGNSLGIALTLRCITLFPSEQGRIIGHFYKEDLEGAEPVLLKEYLI